MINALFTRSAWMAGITCVALLSACGGGGGGGDSTPTPTPTPTPTETGFAAMSVPDGFKFDTKGIVSSISLSRSDSANIDADTTIVISEWTCKTSDNTELPAPVATSEVMREVVSVSAKTATVSDVRMPSSVLLVEVFNGNSVYYAKRHDMASSGNLAINLNIAPASETEMNQQFDKCP